MYVTQELLSDEVSINDWIAIKFLSIVSCSSVIHEYGSTRHIFTCSHEGKLKTGINF